MRPNVYAGITTLVFQAVYNVFQEEASILQLVIIIIVNKMVVINYMSGFKQFSHHVIWKRHLKKKISQESFYLL